MEWFANTTSLQAAAGRAASEYQRDAERHLQEALELQPGAAEIVLALIQVCSRCWYATRMSGLLNSQDFIPALRLQMVPVFTLTAALLS